MLHRQLTVGSERDRGDTLVELIIAIAVIGIAVSGLIAALITALMSSGVHRSLANLDSILRSNAEEATYLIELQPSAWFQDGATVTPTTYNSNTIPFSTPSGYTIVISGIGYWNSSTDQFDSSYVAPSDTSGYQLLTLKATAPSGASETLSVGLRSST